MGFVFSKIFNSLVGQKEMRILILGLDNSGKTTILYKLHLNEVIQTAPSIRNYNVAMGFNVETLTYKNLKFQVWDLGGQNAIRLYWRSYYPNTNGIIYVIDSFDKDRLKTSKEELFTLLQEEELKGVPLLILANKQVLNTLFRICKELKVRLKFVSSFVWMRKSPEIGLCMSQLIISIKCSALTGLGLNEGMEWMANAMKK